MTKKEAIQALVAYNKWRRDENNEHMQISPVKVREAVNVAKIELFYNTNNSDELHNAFCLIDKMQEYVQSNTDIMPNPIEYGKAIDIVINHLNK